MKVIRTRLGVAKFALAVLAACGLAFAGSAAAFASGNAYTVVVGGSSSGDHDFEAHSNGAISFQVKHGSNIVNMDCQTVDVPSASSGSADVHAGTNIVDIATFTSSDWGDCSGPGGPLEVTQNGEWAIHGTSPATSGTSDDIDGHVDGVFAHVESPLGLCSFDVSGPNANDPGHADGTYHESGGTNSVLEVNETGFTGNLTVHNANCLGQITDGDPANFVGEFTVISPDGNINVQ